MAELSGAVQSRGSSRELTTEWAAAVSARAYGVRLDLRVNDATLVPAIVARLPPGARTCPASTRAVEFSIARTTAPLPSGPVDYWQVRVGAELHARTQTEAEALELLEGLVRFEVARRSPLWTFVHAGAVGWCGRAILLPGRSFAGKSTLVHALVRAGATYYSDEYAVLDRRGRLYPFAQALTMRRGSGSSRRFAANELGAGPGRRPLPVGLVIATRYQPDAAWNPVRLSPADGVLALLEHTVRAQDAPARAMRLLACIAETAPVLKSARGEAEETAAALLKDAVWHSEQRDVA